MTNSMIPLPHDRNRANALANLAATILLADDHPDNDRDLLDIINEICSMLPDADAAELRLRLDLCPIHHCDLDTCADDDRLECSDYRA